MLKKNKEFSRLFIGNLDVDAAKDTIHLIFEKYGDIQEEIKMHKGFCFIQYDSPKMYTLF